MIVETKEEEYYGERILEKEYLMCINSKIIDTYIVGLNYKINLERKVHQRKIISNSGDLTMTSNDT